MQTLLTTIVREFGQHDRIHPSRKLGVLVRHGIKPTVDPAIGTVALGTLHHEASNRSASMVLPYDASGVPHFTAHELVREVAILVCGRDPAEDVDNEQTAHDVRIEALAELD